MSRPYLQVLVATDEVPARLRAALRLTPARVAYCQWSEARNEGSGFRGDAYVIVLPESEPESLSRARWLLDCIARRPRAVLVIQASGEPVARIEHPPVVPVSFDTGEPDARVLAARLCTLLDARRALAEMDGAAAVAKAVHQRAAGRFARVLRTAANAQREFLPASLPELSGLSFSCIYRPLEYVSGDFYDVQRVDSDHVGIALADATGHGITAALITVLVKRALSARVRGEAPLSPSGVLARLNTELLEADLTQCRFVTACYALINTRTRVMQIARGGAPAPIVRRSDGELVFVDPEGGVVGVLPEMHFENRSVQLEPGDEVLFCTDGVEELVQPRLAARGLTGAFAAVATAARRLDVQQGRLGNSDESLDATDPHIWDVITQFPGGELSGLSAESQAEAEICAQLAHEFEQERLVPLERTPWMSTLRANGARKALDELRGRYDVLRRLRQVQDDVTAISMHVRPV